MQTIQPSFSKGEISPALFGRVDVSAYQVGLAEAANAVVHSYGGVSKRPGLKYLSQAAHHDKPPRLIPFQFNIDDAYVLEFSENSIRFLRDDQWVSLRERREINFIFTANPVEVVLSSTIFSTVNDDYLIMIKGVNGTTELNQNLYKIRDISGDQVGFILTDLNDVDIDGSTFTSYVSGGVVISFNPLDPKNIITVNHPYSYEELWEIRYVQSGDVVTLIHPNHPPYELRRLTNDEWDLRVIDFSPTVVDSINLAITVNSAGAVDQRYRVTGTTTEGVETLPIIANPETVNQIVSITDNNAPLVTTYGTNTLANGDEIEIRNMTGHPLNNRRFTVLNRTSTTFKLFTTDLAPVDSAGIGFVSGTVAGNGTRVDTSSTITGLASTSSFQVGNPISGTGIPAGAVIRAITSLSTLELGDLNGNSVAATSSGTSTVTVRTGAGRIHKTFYQVAGNATINNTLDWIAVEGVRTYSIYRALNGIYGLIGESSSNTFIDSNIAPTTSVNPPNYREPFLNEDNYPRATAFFQQRRVLGGTQSKPDTSEFSQVGDYNNFSRSFPLQNDDALSVTLSSNSVNQIEHYISQRDLIIFTDSSEWTISGGSQGGLTPDTLTQRLQSNWGSSQVPPLVVDTRVMFNTPDGSGIRDIGYSFEIDGYRGTDLAIFSSHLFNAKTVTAWDYSAHPEGRVWVVRDDGVGLCLSVELDQQINAWTRIVTDGEFEDVIVIRRRLADDIYWVVKRVIDGNTVRYIEKMNDVFVEDYRESFLVDSGLSYDGAPVSSVSGLSHLEGETVVALADGTVIEDLVVTSGSVALGASYSKVTVGLPYTCLIKTLRIEVPQRTVQNRIKRIHKIAIRFYRSRGLEVGPSLSFMTPLREEEFYEEAEDTDGLYSGDREIVVDTSWNTKGQMFLQQSQPLPFTVLAVMPSWDVEDGM